MYTQWKQLRPERQASGAREIERLPAAAALGVNVDITTLADLGKLQSQIESITITHGTREVRNIERPNVKIRKDDSQWKLIVLLNPSGRKAAERRHQRI